MNGLKCALVRRVETPKFQWNLTAIIRKAITVTKTPAAAQIAAWMKLTLKRTLYGHLGVMQVNKYSHFQFNWILVLVLVFLYFYCLYEKKNDPKATRKRRHLFLLIGKKAFSPINIISHCMVIGHKLWKQYAKYFLAAKHAHAVELANGILVIIEIAQHTTVALEGHFSLIDNTAMPHVFYLVLFFVVFEPVQHPKIHLDLADWENSSIFRISIRAFIYKNRCVHCTCCT